MRLTYEPTELGKLQSSLFFLIGATCGTHNALLTPAVQWKLLAGRHRSSTPFPLQQEPLSHTGTFPHRSPAFLEHEGVAALPRARAFFFALSGGCLW
jgi:hypothetical protein